MGACQTQSGAAAQVDTSDYPKTLSVSVRKHLEKYAREDYPLAFLIAKDGGYSVYWRCNGPTCVRGDDTYIKSAQEVCRRNGHLGDCLVHSIRDRKVWPVPEVFESGVRSRLTVPWKYSNQGPAAADGVILYVPGFGGHRFPPALDHERVPSYLRTLNKQGIDVLRLNIAHYDMSITNDAEINQRIGESVSELRTQGYTNVFLVGQSRGAWQILGALKAEIPVDGAILTAPAAHGRAERWNGETNTRYVKSSEDFRELMAEVRDYPLLFTLFEGDEYDPGDRVRGLADMHPDRLQRSIFVLDQPDEFIGHGVAGHSGFAAAYGDCLKQFLAEASVVFDNCRLSLDPENEFHAARREHLVERGGERLNGLKLRNFMDGRAFHPARGNPAWWGMLARPNGTMLQWFPGTYLSGNLLESKWAVDDDRFCLIDSARHNRNRYCYEVWEMPSGNTGLVAPDGLAFIAASVEAETVSQLGFKPGNWKGE